MTEAMPFLQKYDITFLRPPAIRSWLFYVSLLRGAQRKILPRRATQFLPLLLQR